MTTTVKAYRPPARRQVSNERTTVTVIGDGAVGLMAVLSAEQLGAERIILMGRHQARTDLGLGYGATEVVAERGEAGIEKVRELTGGDGTHTVLECVGHRPAYDQALRMVRPGGVISRVGVPQYEDAPIGFGSVSALTSKPCCPRVLDGTVDPGKVFDRTIEIDAVPDGYRAMDSRKALKALVRP